MLVYQRVDVSTINHSYRSYEQLFYAILCNSMLMLAAQWLEP